MPFLPLASDELMGLLILEVKGFNQKGPKIGEVYCHPILTALANDITKFKVGMVKTTVNHERGSLSGFFVKARAWPKIKPTIQLDPPTVCQQ